MAETSEIIERLDLKSFYSNRLDRFRVSQNGKQAMARCPFHSDRTPSFSVNLITSQWHCHGRCGSSGDVFEFLHLIDNLSFGEAKDSLAKLAGLSNGYSGKSKPMPKKKVLVLSEVRLDLINKMMTDDGEKTVEELLNWLLELEQYQISMRHIAGLQPNKRKRWIQIWSDQQTGALTTTEKITKMLTLVSLATR